VTIRFCKGRWRGATIDLGNTEFVANPQTGTLNQATIEFNECDRSFASPHHREVGHYDLQAVLTHELGHVLGLDHSNNPAALMYRFGGGVEKRSLRPDDATALAALYLGRFPPTQHRAEGKEKPSPQTNTPQEPADMPLHPPVRMLGAASSTHAIAPTQPSDSVSVLELKSSNGHPVMLFTCEPTILPPLTSITSPPTAREVSKRHKR
jgi:hypothetical protein